MSTSSKQLLRQIKFIAELRNNNYPNTESFAEFLRQCDIDDNFDFKCDKRTVLRDINILKNDYDAPIEYDTTLKGYYLKNPEWEFSCPVIIEEFLSMSILGTKLSSDILPESLKKKLDDSVDQMLSTNKSKFFDSAMIESLLCASGLKTSIPGKIFETVFDAWRLHQVLAINYRSPKGEESERKVEPHIIAFHHGIWYIKGYDYGTKNIKVYAVQRIQKAKFGGDNFVTDKKLIEDTKRNGLFIYPKIDGIKLHCDASIAFYLYEHQKIKKFKIEPQSDGSLFITLKPAVEHDVIRFVLGEAGHIRVLEPESLREKVLLSAQKLLERNS